MADFSYDVPHLIEHTEIYNEDYEEFLRNYDEQYLNEIKDLNLENKTCSQNYDEKDEYLNENKDLHLKTNINPNSIIYKLINLLTPIEEDAKDISTENISYNKKSYNIRICLICGAKSGTEGIITHFYNCKYSGKFKHDELSDFYHLDSKISKEHLSYRTIFGINQREIVSVDENGPLIGTFGAATCIIIAMRNRIDGFTTLAHIDALTQSWLSSYLANHRFDSTDIYLSTLGQSEELLFKILTDLKSKNFTELVYVNLNNDNLAINPNTGNIITYFDPMYNISNSQLNMDNIERQVYNKRLMFPGILTRVKITSNNLYSSSSSSTGSTIAI